MRISNLLRLILASYLLFSPAKADAQNITVYSNRDLEKIVEVNDAFSSQLKRLESYLDMSETRLEIEKEIDYSYNEKGGVIYMDENKTKIEFKDNISPDKRNSYNMFNFYNEFTNKDYFCFFHVHNLRPEYTTIPIGPTDPEDFRITKYKPNQNCIYGPQVVFSVGYSCLRISAINQGKLVFEKEYKRLIPFKLNKDGKNKTN